MKKLLFVLAGCFFLTACTKQQEISTVSPLAGSNKAAHADVIYYYKGQAYPLYYQEGSIGNFLKDENFTALQAATAQHAIVTFTYDNQPNHHFYLFDNEMEGYDYLEKNAANPLIGRKFKLSYRIDELRENLKAQFGEQLDFKNAAVAQAAQQGVKAIYQELQMNVPFPNDLEAFIGVETASFARQKSSSLGNNPVLTVWADINFQGNEMYVEQAPNTVIWNYGAWNCFTMAANPDLTLEFQANGNNWNDCISSQCLSYIQGADAMGVGIYKDSHFGVYNSGFRILIYLVNGPYPDPPCFNHTTQNWYHPNGWAGHMNDQISSIRVKAIWQGCYTGYSDFNDLENK